MKSFGITAITVLVIIAAGIAAYTVTAGPSSDSTATTVSNESGSASSCCPATKSADEKTACSLKAAQAGKECSLKGEKTAVCNKDGQTCPKKETCCGTCADKCDKEGCEGCEGCGDKGDKEGCGGCADKGDKEGCPSQQTVTTVKQESTGCSCGGCSKSDQPQT